MDCVPQITVDSVVILNSPDVRKSSGKELLRGLVSKFENGQWTDTPFRAFVWRHMKTACLTPSESAVIVGNPDEKLKDAVRRLRKEKPQSKSRGSEIAEICLYGILKEFYGCSVAISKIFHKQNRNDTVKGADSVHFRISDDGAITYWYGEAKFYKSIGDLQINKIVESVADIFDEQKMEHENSIVIHSTDLGEALGSSEAGAEVRDTFAQGMTDKLKRRLHIPILLVYEFKPDDIVDEESFRLKVKEHQEALAKAYYLEHIKKIGCLPYYTDVHFHLILFPVPLKKDLVDRFIVETESVEEGQALDCSSNEIFDGCREAAGLSNAGDIPHAREQLIRLLDKYGAGASNNLAVNHLLRATGLFSYMGENSNFVNSLLKYSFAQDVGANQTVVLHKDQSEILRMLLEGRDLIVSAPTSFGKSFIIDAFIAAKKPRVVVIIVPTLALTDETRRRLMRKFGDEYEIMTNAEITTEPAIYVFPQERALQLARQVVAIDIMVVDEFYKIDPEYDKDRAGTLFEVMVRLLPFTKQCYCLAPYIDEFQMGLIPALARPWNIRIIRNPTVVQQEYDVVSYLNTKEAKERSIEKERIFRTTIKATAGQKTILYVGTHHELWEYARSIRQVLIDESLNDHSEVLSQFASWLRYCYTEFWMLPQCVERGIGVHNGRMHRDICMLQLKLFDAIPEFHFMNSTTSIVEGVNTSAKNVIVCSRKKGPSNLDSLTYKNIKGRAGRMSKHYVGNVWLFDKPSKVNEIERVDLSITKQDMLPFLSADVNVPLGGEDSARLEVEKQMLLDGIGEDLYQKIIATGKIRRIRAKRLITLVDTLRQSLPLVASLRSLMQFAKPEEWYDPLQNIQKPLGFYVECHPKWGGSYGAFARDVIALSYNWTESVRDVLSRFYPSEDIPIERYFDVERQMSYKFSGLLSDLNVVLSSMYPSSHIDLSEWVYRSSNAFLPEVVFSLEEMGLPRMISRKIQDAGMFNFEKPGTSLKDALVFFQTANPQKIMAQMHSQHPFDEYVLRYFYDGLPDNTTQNPNR